MRRQAILLSTAQPASLRHLLKRTLTARQFLRCLVFVVVPAVLVYGLAIRLLTASGFSLIQAIRDPAQQTETSSWLGLVSNLGVLMMVSAAVICLFVVSIKPPAASKVQRECLLLMGLLSAFLALDDFFLLHDRHLGEGFCYAMYAFCLVMLLYRHYKTILSVDGIAFLFAGGLLGLSIATDVFQSDITSLSDSVVQLFEEGFKFAGMATWLYFSYRMASFFAAPKRIR